MRQLPAQTPVPRPAIPFALTCLLLLTLACDPTPAVGAVEAADEDLPEPSFVLPLWPDQEIPPGDENRPAPPANNPSPTGQEEVSWRRVLEVTHPELWIYQPEQPAPGRAAVLVCPGGGYNRLAFDHEGTMVAQWLNQHGITALLLKYRVPRRSPDQPHEVPLKDARRAMGLARHHAAQWGINPDRIGALGFSAGGDLALRLSLASGERDYPAHEQFDAAETRPDFLVLVYPAYLVDEQSPGRLRDDFDFNQALPSAFFVHAHDDPHPASASALLYLQWHAAKVPAELHINALGGHGFGMRQRPGNLPVNHWPQRCLEWVDSMSWRAAP